MRAYDDRRCEEITILIADDDALARGGLKSVLQTYGAFSVVAETDNRESLLALVGELLPNIVIMDAGLLPTFGMQIMADLSDASPETKVILIGISASPETIIRSLQAGVKGYIPKSATVEQFKEACLQVAQGMSPVLPNMAGDLLRYVLENRPNSQRVERDTPLTRRQYEVLRQMVRGLCNKEIAANLHVSETTVKSHVTGILRKLGVSDRTQAVVKALRDRIVVPEDQDVSAG